MKLYTQTCISSNSRYTIGSIWQRTIHFTELIAPDREGDSNFQEKDKVNRVCIAVIDLQDKVGISAASYESHATGHHLVYLMLKFAPFSLASICLKWLSYKVRWKIIVKS